MKIPPTFTINFFTAIIIIILSQIYYSLATYFIYPVDSFQDFAFVIGHSFPDLIYNQYQYYLYGFVPFFTAFIGTKICLPGLAFTIINTLLSICYAGIITFLVIDYIKLNKYLQFILSLLLVCLLLNPGEPVFGWKIPYTIGLPLGIFFSLLFFKFSIDYIIKKNLIYLLLLIITGLIAISTKVEFAAVVISYFIAYLLINYLKRGKLKNKTVIIIGLTLFICVAYLNWVKLMPPYLKMGNWCSENISYEIFLKETTSASSQDTVNASNHLKDILGLNDLDICQALDFLFQSILLISLIFLEKNSKLEKINIKFYKAIIVSAYFIYLLSMAWLVPFDSIKNIQFLTFLLIIINFKKLISDEKLYLLAIFTILFSARTIFNIKFSFFSVYYMFPVLLLFFAVSTRYIQTKYVTFFYIGVLLLALVFKVDSFIFDHKKVTKSLSYAQHNEKSDGLTLSVDPSFYELINEIQKIESEYHIKTIASAKNIPFLNAYFKKPNPVKKYVNVEFYPFIHDSCYKKYISEIKKTKPDVFIYARQIMEYYITAEKRHNLPQNFFIKKDNMLMETFQRLYNNTKRISSFYIFYDPKNKVKGV